MVISSLHPPSTRPVAMGVNGMVSSAHPLASAAGLGVLMDGGNAFDAAVATAAALGVVEPYMSGVGGIGMALLYDASQDRIRALNFSGRAPSAAEHFMYRQDNHEIGPMSALIPGSVAGWLTIHETYCTLDLDRLFKPAVDYASNGFSVTLLNSRTIRRSAERLSRFPDSAAIMLNRGGGPPAPGSRIKMPQLAKSLEAISRGGKEEFYRGELAEKIVRGNHNLGGLFTPEDLASYEAFWQEPITIDYRGYQMNAIPPNSSGFQILETLKMVEGFDGEEMVYQHPRALHMFIEAAKLAVTDRIKYGGDPAHVKAPLDRLLSDDYAERQRARIGRERVAIVSGEHYVEPAPDGSLTPGDLDDREGGMTTHFAVADRDGNVVSVTQTLGGAFGSAVAVGDTGIFLNNMALWFDLDEGSPNLLGPGKLVDFVVSPIQAFKDGRFYASMGTPGSYGILQTTPQFLMNLLDYGMNVQQAIEAPRLKVVSGKQVEMEERFPLHIRQALEGIGHAVNVVEAWSMSVGGAQGLVADQESGVFQGGADPRRDGTAIGW